jgi:hypothetical protein
MGRPKYPDGTSDGPRDELMRQTQFLPDVMGALEMELLVMHGVIAHFM